MYLKIQPGQSSVQFTSAKFFLFHHLRNWNNSCLSTTSTMYCFMKLQSFRYNVLKTSAHLNGNIVLTYKSFSKNLKLISRIFSYISIITFTDLVATVLKRPGSYCNETRDPRLRSGVCGVVRKYCFSDKLQFAVITCWEIISNTLLLTVGYQGL